MHYQFSCGIPNLSKNIYLTHPYLCSLKEFLTVKEVFFLSSEGQTTQSQGRWQQSLQWDNWSRCLSLQVSRSGCKRATARWKAGAIRHFHRFSYWRLQTLHCVDETQQKTQWPRSNSRRFHHIYCALERMPGAAVSFTRFSVLLSVGHCMQAFSQACNEFDEVQ